jgi:hypothetical protein
MKRWLIPTLVLVIRSLATAHALGLDVPIAKENQATPAVANAAGSDNRLRFATFHSIFFFDSNDPNHRSALNNEAELNKLFERFSADAEKDMSGRIRYVRFPLPLKFFPKAHVLHGDQATRKDLYELIDRLDADDVNGFKDGDVVFFWGEVEGDTKGGQIRLVPSSGPAIRRDELIGKLEFRRDGRKRTWLTVCITDNCQAPFNIATALAAKGEHTSIWRGLYFGHNGTVDIISSAPGKQAFAAGERSLFGHAFADMFDESIVPRRNLQDPTGFVTWEKFVVHLKTEADRVYDDFLHNYYEYDRDANGRPIGLPKAKTTPAFAALGSADQSYVAQMRTNRIAGDHLPTTDLTRVHVNSPIP